MGSADDLKFADLEAVGPGTPSGRYLRRFWHPVHRACDLKPNRAKPIEILGEKFTLYRGEPGTAHLISFRCAHRGTQMSLGWVEGDDLRCRYHGWKYDASGQCIEQPNEDRPFCARVKMPSYPTREYAGLIFAYLGEGEPPPFKQHPDFDRPGVVIADPVEILPCNFWNRLDNDLAHVPWVHRATAQRKGWNNYLILRREKVEETAYGIRTTKLTTNGEIDTSLGIRGTANFYLPNVRQWWQRSRAKGYESRDLWDTKITWTVPINDHTYAGFDATSTPLQGEEAQAYAASRIKHQEEEAETRWDLAEKVLGGEMTLEDLSDDLTASTTFTIEDYCTQVGQGPLAGRGRERLASSDALTILIRRLWLSEVRALLENRPLTEWPMPAAPFQSIAGT